MENNPLRLGVHTSEYKTVIAAFVTVVVTNLFAIAVTVGWIESGTADELLTPVLAILAITVDLVFAVIATNYNNGRVSLKKDAVIMQSSEIVFNDDYNIDDLDEAGGIVG